MVGYLIRKEETKTSKRVVIKDVNGEETKYLVNIDDLDSLPLNVVVAYEIGEKKYSMFLITNLKMLTAEEIDNNPEAKLVDDMYKPKPVPKLTEMMHDIIDFVNETPDQSNIGGGPRHIEFDDLKSAISILLEDEVFDKNTCEWKTVSRVSDFVKASASTIYHDSQRGGLLRHTAKLVQMAILSHKCKYQTYEVHPLTLMIGILVHDIGKIDQYSEENGAFILTEWYKYRGSHIGMGIERWSRNGRKFLKALKVADCDVENLFWDIFHIIGSHHGPVKTEYGSFWDPFGHDASLVFGLDYVESHQEETIKPPRTE